MVIYICVLLFCSGAHCCASGLVCLLVFIYRHLCLSPCLYCCTPVALAPSLLDKDSSFCGFSVCHSRRVFSELFSFVLFVFWCPSSVLRFFYVLFSPRACCIRSVHTLCTWCHSNGSSSSRPRPLSIYFFALPCDLSGLAPSQLCSNHSVYLRRQCTRGCAIYRQWFTRLTWYGLPAHGVCMHLYCLGRPGFHRCGLHVCKLLVSHTLSLAPGMVWWLSTSTSLVFSVFRLFSGLLDS